MGRTAVPFTAAVAGIAIAAAATSAAEDWRPLSLVATLAVLGTIADSVVVSARRIRLSAGMTVLVIAMALLGPAPAVAIAAAATIVESVVWRVRPLVALANILIFGLLALVGGLAFDVLRALLDLDARTTEYALLVGPVYFALAALNLWLVATLHPELTPEQRRRVLRESGVPALPLELANAVLATAAVLVWANAGVAPAVGVLAVLVVTVPFLRTVGAALKSGDELLDAERRERARLAEALHDGPMQRLIALRERLEDPAELDTAIAETRAIVASLHPAAAAPRGFEASLRSAMSALGSVSPPELTVRAAFDDRLLAGTLLMPVARELVVNAVKHGRPTRVDVYVSAFKGQVMLEVADDGVGIDAGDAAGAVHAGHVGLAILRRRVEDAGGSLEIGPGSGGGTRSRVVVSGLS